jgi:hypothetical protein
MIFQHLLMPFIDAIFSIIGGLFIIAVIVVIVLIIGYNISAHNAKRDERERTAKDDLPPPPPDTTATFLQRQKDADAAIAKKLAP